ncbi:unnamed protein product [Meganyctiphanes norvegica]|uniref:Uncharacterized protein n=1 Tax=Meganyctiphanes norvegica TaxID=48144 RepID=A0AAV2QJH9_MEGNR
MKLRYKGLFTPNVAPTRRAYCILFSFVCGVVLLTVGSVFAHVILIHPMSGTRPMHTPPWPMAMCLIVSGVLTVLISCMTAWRYGMDDGDESLLEDDYCSYSKEDPFDHEYGTSRNPYHESKACVQIRRQHCKEYRTCNSSLRSNSDENGNQPCPQSTANCHESGQKLSSHSHYQQTQQCHQNNNQENLPRSEHIPDVGENQHTHPIIQDCIKSQCQNETCVVNNDGHQIVQNRMSHPNKKLFHEQDQNQHKQSESPIINDK